MEAATLAAQTHARFGLILARADACLARVEQRDRLARRLRAKGRRR